MRLLTQTVAEDYCQALFKLAFGVCRNREDAEDAVQDTLIKYDSSRREFDSPEHLRAWLSRVCINRAKDISTSFWRRHKVDWEEEMESLPFHQPEDQQIFEAVMELPRKYRLVIHLHYYEGYTVKEISAILKIRENTVKSQLSRGRALLKTALQEVWEDE